MYIWPVLLAFCSNYTSFYSSRIPPQHFARTQHCLTVALLKLDCNIPTVQYWDSTLQCSAKCLFSKWSVYHVPRLACSVYCVLFLLKCSICSIVCGRSIITVSFSRCLSYIWCPFQLSPLCIFGLMPQLKHTWPACISPFSLSLSLTSGSDRFLIGSYDSYEPYVVLADLSSFVLFKLVPEGICFLTEELDRHKMSNYFNLSSIASIANKIWYMMVSLSVNRIYLLYQYRLKWSSNALKRKLYI